MTWLFEKRVDVLVGESFLTNFLLFSQTESNKMIEVTQTVSVTTIRVGFIQISKKKVKIRCEVTNDLAL